MCAHIVAYYTKKLMNKRKVRGLDSWAFVSKIISLSFFFFSLINPRYKRMLRASSDCKQEEAASCEELWSLSLSGCKRRRRVLIGFVLVVRKGSSVPWPAQYSCVSNLTFIIW